LRREDSPNLADPVSFICLICFSVGRNVARREDSTNAVADAIQLYKGARLTSLPPFENSKSSYILATFIIPFNKNSFSVEREDQARLLIRLPKN